MVQALAHAPPACGHILVVEDDREIARMLQAVLAEASFTSQAAASAAEMDRYLAGHAVDLIVLDVMLPGEDGLSACRRVRAAGSTPIIMLTARGGEVDRVLGLELGADDYIAKPFSSREVVARIRAVLRRARGGGAEPAQRATPLQFEGWRIDPAARQLHDPAGVRVALTSAEFDLLLAFCHNAGRVLSREQLLDLTYAGAAGPIERSIDVHISRLRRKIERDRDEPLYIRTVRLGGYVFTPAVEPG